MIRPLSIHDKLCTTNQPASGKTYERLATGGLRLQFSHHLL